ncbi:MAG TPA: bifunctional phosphopantothenoylcysteine decarboxylase/phosphopantothenate--cysteine ligase CoaBC [Clostridia bacterium]
MLRGKSVVLGVCGGIAAYKVVEVVSRLKKLNADVNVIMTDNAMEFITPLTFQAMSHNPVTSDMFKEPKNWDVEHISLARKADIFVIAPATANIIGKIANGIADDMITTTVMATKAPVLFVPAMNHAMYENPIMQENIKKLKKVGYTFLEPETGLMAAEGEYGKGRLPEPLKIVEEVKDILCGTRDLENVRILVTAGPTREPLDPVRYISNHSSGKMGYAIAEAAAKRGAEVTLISGPVNIPEPNNINIVNVVTAEEMYDDVMKRQETQDVFIMVAAVADFRCDKIADNKIKKGEDNYVLNLVKNPDIAREVGKIKGNRLLIGFCAETENLVDSAFKKIQSKNLDMIAANDVTMEGAGFGEDTNIVKLVLKDGTINELPLLTKKDVADKILDEVVKMRQK